MDKILEHKYEGGDYYKVFASRLCAHIESGDNYTDEHHRVMLTRVEAIAAAKAILKHFDVDYNAYEDNLSNRYRQTTQDELKKFYENNPHITPIPAHIYDPDAPLTSELMP